MANALGGQTSICSGVAVKIVRPISTLLGIALGVVSVLVGRQQETVGGFIAIGGGLWIGSMVSELGYRTSSAHEIIRGLAVGTIGLMVFVFGLGTILGIFGVIMYLLDNPVTKTLTLLPASVAEFVSPVLIPIVLGPLTWIAAKALSALDEDGDAWTMGFSGAMRAPVALLPIGLIGLSVHLVSTNLLGVRFGATGTLVYVAAFGAMYGWFVPLAVGVSED